MKRRDVLKVGAIVAPTPAIFGGAGIAHAQLCRREGNRSPITEPDSPPVSSYTQPLYFPPALAEVFEVSLNPPPGPNRHQRYNEFLPAKFYVQHLTEGLWSYHNDLSTLNPNDVVIFHCPK